MNNNNTTLQKSAVKAYKARAAELASVPGLSDASRCNDEELKKIADFSAKCAGVELLEAPLWHHLQGVSQTKTGYGSKLATRYKLRIGRRLYRVYAKCYSNVSTEYILFSGKMIIIDLNDHLKGGQ